MDTMHLLHHKHPAAQSVIVILVGLVHLTLAGCVVGQDASNPEPSEPILVAEFPEKRGIALDLDKNGDQDLAFVVSELIGLSESAGTPGVIEVKIEARGKLEILQEVRDQGRRLLCQPPVRLDSGELIHSDGGMGRCWGDRSSVLASNYNTEDPDVEWEFEYEPEKPFLIGVRVKKMTQYHYGWVQLLLEPIQSHSKLRVTVLDAFVHPGPNTRVLAGKDDGTE